MQAGKASRGHDGTLTGITTGTGDHDGQASDCDDVGVAGRDSGARTASPSGRVPGGRGIFKNRSWPWSVPWDLSRECRLSLVDPWGSHHRLCVCRKPTEVVQVQVPVHGRHFRIRQLS